jgi:hypothetical protein
MPDQELPPPPEENQWAPRQPAPPPGALPTPQQPAPEQYVAAPEDSEFIEIDPDEPGDAPARPSALRTAGIVSARVVTGIVVVAVVGATVAAASLLPLPSIRHSGPSTVVTPVPTAQQLVCPGGLLRLASASGQGATKASALGSPAIAAAATDGSVDRKSFGSSDAGTANTDGAPQLLSTSSAVAGAGVSGAQSQSVSTDEFVGLSSAACSAPSGAAWLAGGSTAVGRTTLLLLANPSDVPAVVSLDIIGENGPVTAPGMDGITVAAHGQRVLSLAGFAPGLVSPVVHVVSRGGQVVANLEQSTVRGLEPGGIDFVGSETVASRTTVIPGVTLTGTAGVQSRLGEDGFDDLQPTLRIYLPGSKPAEAQVSVISEDGKTLGTASKTDLDPGKVTDLPLDSLSDGNYTIRITSPVPVVASVRASTVGSAAVSSRADFAWMTPAPLLTEPALVTISPNVTSKLHLDNPTKKNETVVVTPVGGGTSLKAVVTAGSAVAVPVTAGTTYSLSGYAGLYASVSGVADGGVTGYVVSPGEQGSTPIRIYG